MPGGERELLRIAIAGFQHETNCFGTNKAGLAEFEMADSWPGMLRGQDVISQTRGMNLPIAGFAKAASQAGLHPVPIVWCSAEPSAHVTDHAFDTICEMLLDGLRAEEPFDGIYLDLHGAMVTESHVDGEGELLGRLREFVGPDLPIVVSLDLHANISPEMVAHASYIAIFRTYPHLDMAETGARCVPVLCSILAGELFYKAFRQMPYLIPLQAQYTGAGPCRQLYDNLRGFGRAGVLADIALGFTAADLPNTRPSCVAYDQTHEAATRAADQIASLFDQVESKMDHSMLTLEDVKELVFPDTSHAPVVIADVQDNPGAGATSDTTGLLAALEECGARSVLMGLFNDPSVAEAAHAHGLGAVFHAEIGGKSGLPGQTQFEADVRVIALSDGVLQYTGKMYGGGTAHMGKTAALRLVETAAEIDLVVTSIRNQCLDFAQFVHLGLNPSTYRIICVKSTVHYRADFEPIAGDVHVVASPGAFPCDLSLFPYKNLHREVRKSPKST